MPEHTITVGGKEFRVACQDGEEHFLEAAAKMLDTEAQNLLHQIGRLPEARMLLMAGLMLADRTAALEDQLREARAQQAETEAALQALRAKPERIEVPSIPPHLTDSLAEMAARAEAVAERLEENTGNGPAGGSPDP